MAQVCVQPMQFYLCFSTHRRGRTWGFLCSWVRSRCRLALLWSTWPTAGSASGDGGSSTPEPPSRTRPASCPLEEEEEQNSGWIYPSFHYLGCPFVYAAFMSLIWLLHLQPSLQPRLPPRSFPHFFHNFHFYLPSPHSFHSFPIFSLQPFINSCKTFFKQLFFYPQYLNNLHLSFSVH